MSLTMTMLLVSWAKHAPLINCFRSVRYPEVRNVKALATRCGVLSSPSRPGSSPISINSSRTKRPIFSAFKSIAGYPFATTQRGPRSLRDIVRPSPLRFEGTQVRGDRHHLLDGQLGDDRFHELGQGTGAITGLHVMKLAEDIDGRTSDDTGHLAEALQRWTMADGALNGPARAAVRDQRLAFRDAAGRHVIDKARVGVAAVRPARILRQHDDAIADRLGAAARRGKTHGSRADVAFRHGFGLDHLGPNTRFEGGEVFAGGAHVGVRNRLRDLDHRRRSYALPVSALELGHLAHEVRDGKTREAGGFGVAVSGREMAERARACRLFPVGNDLRHRRMLIGKPVRRIEAVVDLRLRVLLRAPGHLLLHHIVKRPRLGRGRISPLQIVGSDRNTRKQSNPQDTNEILHESLHDRASRSSKARLRSTPQ